MSWRSSRTIPTVRLRGRWDGVAGTASQCVDVSYYFFLCAKRCVVLRLALRLCLATLAGRGGSVKCVRGQRTAAVTRSEVAAAIEHVFYFGCVFEKRHLGSRVRATSREVVVLAAVGGIWGSFCAWGVSTLEGRVSGCSWLLQSFFFFRLSWFARRFLVFGRKTGWLFPVRHRNAGKVVSSWTKFPPFFLFLRCLQKLHVFFFFFFFFFFFSLTIHVLIFPPRSRQEGAAAVVQGLPEGLPTLERVWGRFFPCWFGRETGEKGFIQKAENK